VGGGGVITERKAGFVHHRSTVCGTFTESRTSEYTFPQILDLLGTL
jgi:hypothetical protein